MLDCKKDMIVSRHPDVAEVAVIGIPHEKWGETPLALACLGPDLAE